MSEKNDILKKIKVKKTEETLNDGKNSTVIEDGKLPVCKRFDELIKLLPPFLKKNRLAKINGLELCPLLGSRGTIYQIKNPKHPDVWATLRRNRGWHTINKGALQAALRQDPKLREFFDR